MEMIAEESWRSLGTSAHVLVTDAAALRPAVLAVRSILEKVDETYSRFRPDSELSRLNQNPGASAPVSPLLFKALDVALQAARQSDGAVDPTVGSAIRLLGYDRDFAAITGDGALTLTAQAVPGWQALHLDPSARTARLESGVEIDLGSTGKALAAELAVEAAHRAIGCGVLVSLGGDIATAGNGPAAGWRILCAESSETAPDGPGEVIVIRSGALATSSTTVRHWTTGGVTRHHIIDPATGLPATGPWRTITVAAASCVNANTAATGAIVRGDQAIGWLERLALPARLVSQDGEVRRVAGWPAPLRPAA